MSIFYGSAENIENTDNKVTTVTESSTNEEYPSAKTLYERTKNYIIEQGTETTEDGMKWHFRKWADGTAECWGSYSQDIACPEAAGNVYAGNTPFARKKYPTGLFVEVPCEMATLSVPYTMMSWIYTQGGNNATGTGQYNIMRWSKQATASNCTINYYALGTWKETENGE